MNPLIMRTVPSLRRPVLIVAFLGWNDAGEAATTAVQFLCRQMKAQKFASLDPEEFYVFANQRPQVRFTTGGERELLWPANDFWYVQEPAQLRDVVLGLGIEPHLKWRAYVQAVLDLVHQCQVSLVISLGALLAEVVHSQPVRLTGVATDPDLAARLGLTGSRYEGPTGIVGVLNDACRKEGLPAMSLWANVPHYLQGVTNPKAALALVRRVLKVLEWSLPDLSELRSAATAFESRVEQAVASDSQLATYVRQLEEQQQAQAEPSLREEELPSGEDLAEELERFLRQQRRQSPEPPEEEEEG
ncbi:MAG: PAC2 family protein [Candidatus Tectomicrobia bacterium]|uniref:PAC2 family protein n=1 Tax=Tectimicrobiota bacterium TaxID=2528274 RepID=A0A932CND9_UNCTE|nr:PAC2 family protein [Candidatus Tectomicrobia bacterium]